MAELIFKVEADPTSTSPATEGLVTAEFQTHAGIMRRAMAFHIELPEAADLITELLNYFGEDLQRDIEEGFFAPKDRSGDPR